GLTDAVKVIADCICRLPAQPSARVTQTDAVQSITASNKVIACTDPPYYDNIGYADLSDYFYVWLRRSLGSVFTELFSTVMTPKVPELIASPYRHEGDRDAAKSFFECGFGKAFSLIRANADQEYPVTVFYAFKQTESDEEEGDDSDDAPLLGEAVVSTGWE